MNDPGWEEVSESTKLMLALLRKYASELREGKTFTPEYMARLLEKIAARIEESDKIIGMFVATEKEEPLH